MKIKTKYPIGYTLIEVLIVISVIGIISAICIVSYSGVQQKSVDVSLLADIDNMDSIQASYGIKNNIAGKAYYSGNGIDSDLGFTPSDGNIIDVVTNKTDYCIRAYNKRSTKNSIYNAFTKYSDIDACKEKGPSLEAKTASSDPVWSVAGWGSSSYEDGFSIIQTSDGGYAVTGTIDYSDYSDMFLVKYASNGRLSWARTWSNSTYDCGYSLIQTIDGGYAVTGYTGGSADLNKTDMFIVKYSPDGNLTWSKSWGGADYDEGRSLIQTADNGYIVTGNTKSYGVGNYDAFLVKFDVNGNFSWNRTLGEFDNVFSNSIINTSDGGYAITGLLGDEALLVKFDASINISWSKSFGGYHSDSGNSLIQANDSGLVVTGGTAPLRYSDKLFIAKFDLSSGSILWSKSLDKTNYDDYGKSLVKTADGGYAVTGNSNYYGMVIAKYDPSGNLSWYKSLGEDSNSLIQTVDGGYATTGTMRSNYDGDMYIAKYDSSGVIANCPESMCTDDYFSSEDLSFVNDFMATLSIKTPASTVNNLDDAVSKESYDAFSIIVE